VSSTSTIEIFCCYARKDQPLMQSLKTHLMPLQRQGLISIWSDTDINAGKNWQEEIAKHLKAAHIILLLVSPDFIASDYCYSIEMKLSINRHKLNEASVIPIILRPTHWENTPFATLQALPKDAKPVTKWDTEDDALYDVVERIGNVVKELRIQQSAQDALRLYREERYAEALMTYDQLINLDANYAHAHLGKGRTLLAQEKYEESLISFNKAAQLDKTVVDAYFYEDQATALENIQRTEESLNAYDEAIRTATHHVQKAILYEKKARLFSSLQRYTEALDMYKQAITFAPETGSLYEQAGDIYSVLNNFQDALAMYQKAMELAPKRDEYYAKTGQILFQLARFEEAAEIYQAAIAIEPKEIYHLQKGRCLLKLQIYEDALASFEEILYPWEMHDEPCIDRNIAPYVYYEKGRALIHLQRYQKALQSFERAIAFMDFSVDPAFYRGKGLAYERLAEEAYKLAEQATIHENPQDESWTEEEYRLAEQATTEEEYRLAERATTHENPLDEEDTVPAKNTTIEKHTESKQRRLPRGQRTPEKAYYQPILQALVDLGGSSRSNELLPRVEEYMKHILKTVDYDALTSHPGELRWENTARFARNSMVKDGRLKSDSPFGVWEITEKGRHYLDAINRGLNNDVVFRFPYYDDSERLRS
jgi:tetratricopeptide (TPR) repeat protein